MWVASDPTPLISMTEKSSPRPQRVQAAVTHIDSPEMKLRERAGNRVDAGGQRRRDVGRTIAENRAAAVIAREHQPDPFATARHRIQPARKPVQVQMA